MAITSTQAGGMIGGQLGMFGNFASYAQQISPNSAGPSPTYSNPMGQGTSSSFQPPPPPGFPDFNASGTSLMGHAGSALAGTVGAATLAGSFLPGVAGKAFGALDPMTAGISGGLRASGLAANVTSEMGLMARLGSYGSTALKIGSGGVGSIARAGMMGLGGAAIAAAPAVIAGAALQYGVGKMVEGAQFQGQVQNVLGQGFRHSNPGSQTGYGFSQNEGRQIASMVSTMGNKDMTSSPQELLRVMEGGIASGSFKAVSDVREFKKKFTEMVGNLKEVAKVMSTTLEGAMPFLAESKRMGLWTPKDVMGGASAARSAALNSGLSMEQTSGMMQQGASMSRSIGASGMSGSMGMAQSLGVAGGAMRSGVWSDRQMMEATGMDGAEGVQAFAGKMQQSATRFASSGRARWLLAAMSNKSMTGLDAGKMAMMSSGGYSLGDVQSMASKNVSGRGTDFVMGEEEMRGDLLKQGPMAQLGFIKTIAGSHLYGNSSRDKLITRRMMGQYFGMHGKEADMMSDAAKRMPQIMQENQQRADYDADQSGRLKNEADNHSVGGALRSVGGWLQSATNPLWQAGAKVGGAISDAYTGVSNKIWGVAREEFQNKGISSSGIRALQQSAMGNSSGLSRNFASSATMRGLGSSRGYQEDAEGELLKKYGVATKQGTEAQRDAMIAGGTAYSGTSGFGSFGYRDAAQSNKVLNQLSAAGGETLTQDSAAALGFSGTDDASKAFAAAQTDMESSEYKLDVMNAKRSAGKDGYSQEKLNDMIAANAASGKYGKGLKNLMGGDKQTQKMRLLAAQGKDLREGGAGLALGHKMGEGSESNLRATALELQKKMEDLTAQLPGSGTSALMDIFKDPALKNQYMDALKNIDPNDPEYASKVKASLANLAEKLPEDQRNALLDVANKAATDPGVAKTLQGMGDIARTMDAKAGQELLEGRNKRFEESVSGGRKGELISSLNANSSDLTKKGGGGMGDRLNELSKISDPVKRAKKLREIVEAGSRTDSKGLGEMMGQIQNTQGVSGFRAALSAAAQVRGLEDAFKGGDVGKQSMTLSDATGMEISAKDITGLKGNQSTKLIEEKLAGVSDPVQRDMLKKMLMGVKGKGGKSDLSALTEGSIGLGAARAVGADMGDVKGGIDLFMKNAKGPNLAGAAGSSEGMHGTLIKIADILEKMNEKTPGGDKTGNVKEKAPG